MRGNESSQKGRNPRTNRWEINHKSLRRLVLDKWRNVDVGAMENFAKRFKDAELLEVFEWTFVRGG